MSRTVLLHRGAEALITRLEWRGRPAVEKRRVPKGYRHVALDETLRRARLRAEVRLFREARRLGVSVPVLYDVDPEEHRLVMEYVEGPLMKEALQAGGEGRTDLCRRLGTVIGQLHAGDLIHGDLTTSNIIVRDGELVLVDFGMGERSAEVEAKGVDFHLFQEALGSAHSADLDLLEAVVAGYREAYPNAEKVLAKAEEIERRGRYQRGS
ncbi:MAG: KEOPS complex kinase/ATPase Bud32 [Thermoplasmata archaeon]